MVPDFAPPQTPALVIDKAALLHNLETMQRAVSGSGLRLRPHGKMHKCSTLARLQIEMGAVGLCCQTIGEAEAFARAGIADVLVSAPVPRWGPPRLAALQRETGARLSVSVDSLEQIEALKAAAETAGVELGATVDVNIGMHRVGCTPAEAPLLARAIVEAAALRYDGVQAYFGHLQHLAEGRAAANALGTARLKALVADLAAAGLSPPQVTGGGTGTYALDIAGGVFTELQCGSYAVMDAEYDMCGGPEAAWPFDSALYIVASVVSAKHKSHVTIDCGLKATSIDIAPRIVRGAPEGSRWRVLGDEHGAVIHPAARAGDTDANDADPDIPWPADAPKEGGIVWLQPGHCDPTINLYDGFWVIGDDGAEWWPIDARRMTGA
jgi:3-hydroxy-D-aspartate aldolase